MNILLENINWLAVLVSAVVAFVIGATWFGPKTLYPTWMRAMGREVPTERVEMSGGETALMFGGTFVASFIQVATLALILTLARAVSDTLTVTTGALFGFIFSLGLGGFASLSHRMFGAANHKVYPSLKVWIIEIGQDVVAMTVAGAILAVWH
ncbi:MAG: hypothetical protein RLZZ164_220 [Actinomycetota bacterium]|jgi:hypothetical protein